MPNGMEERNKGKDRARMKGMISQKRSLKKNSRDYKSLDK